MADRKPEAKGVPPPKAETPMAKAQRERFIEAGREAGVDDEAFEKGLAKVAPPKKRDG